MKRLSITMFVPGMEFHSNSLTEHSLGGSETAGLSMAQALARLGHEVRIFANVPRAHKDALGVDYVPIDLFRQYAPKIPHDVCIAQRAPVVFGSRIESKINVLWAHDLAMGRQTQEIRSAMWNIDRIFTVSKYHAKQYQEVFDLPDSVMYPTRNGIHLSMQPDPVERKPKQVVYTARPERGLDVLLEKIMPQIWEQDPDVKLVLAAYDNTVDEMRPFYAHIGNMIKDCGDRVEVRGALTKPQLYELYNESALYLYPTPSPTSPNFREVSCITAMECMMCGLPFISSDKGALKETLGKNAGILVPGDSSSEDFQKLFAKGVLNTLSEPVASGIMSEYGRKHAQTLDWQGVAVDWSEKFVKWIEERSKNKRSLALHLIRHSDIIAAEQIAKDINDQAILKEIDEHYGWYKSPETHAEHYEKIGQTHTDVYDTVPTEPRYDAIVRKLEESGETKGRMLDFGCAHGSYAVHLSNRFPELKVYGVDVDRYSIDWAEKHKANHAEHPENVQFSLIKGPADLFDSLFDGKTEDSALPRADLFDAVFIGEVLEHVPEPWTKIEEIEKLVKSGGLVVITVPFGPVEEDSYKTYPHRCHLWELDFFAIRDILKGKQDLFIEQSYLWPTMIQSKPFGQSVVTYKVNPEIKAGKLNMYRKNNLNDVRQSVSVSMICGPGVEETLAWTLESIKDVADEIIIGDTGMSDEGKAIAERYGAKLVPAPNPREEGFDEARNATLPACTMDWILWIDSDEKLINADQIHKYLKPNMFDAYGIHQHHFSIDAKFNPDLPCRLFRNHIGLKFFGSCHEHPEIEINKGPGASIVLSDVHIAHVGYLDERTRRIRFARNKPLMDMSREKFPGRLLNYFFTMRDMMLEVGYALQQTGGKPTPECGAKCQETVAIYREHFCGNAMYMAGEAIKYYSDACRILGIGAEVRLCLNVAKTGDPKEEIATYRYGSVEDLQKDLTANAEQVMKPLCSPNF